MNRSTAAHEDAMAFILAHPRGGEVGDKAYQTYVDARLASIPLHQQMSEVLKRQIVLEGGSYRIAILQAEYDALDAEIANLWHGVMGVVR